jgi:hypothetical protein
MQSLGWWRSPFPILLAPRFVGLLGVFAAGFIEGSHAIGGLGKDKFG